MTMTDEGVSGAAGGEQKATQSEANYRRGTPLKHCGVCTYYLGGENCSEVEGPISGFGFSDVFQMQKNPFGSTLGPREGAMIDSMMQSQPDQSPEVAGPTRIGGKVY